MGEEVIIDMGYYGVGEAPTILVTLGLGSCVGLVLYDPQVKKGGLAHIMLAKIPENKKNDPGFNVDKFADIAIPKMMNELIKKGCEKTRLKAKLVGGAHMFANMAVSDTIDIGRHNIETTKEILKAEGIPLLAEEVGGSVGRTVKFDLSNGDYFIRTKDGNKTI